MKWALALLAIGLLLVLWLTRGDAADVRDLEARIKAREAVIAELVRRSAQRDTVYTQDTIRKTVVRRTTDSILSTDTLWRVDTVRALIAGERKACDRIQQDCEARVATRDTLLAQADTVKWAKDSVIDELKKPCTYFGIRGQCPELSAFGGVATSGPVAGIGLSFPLKKIRVQF